MNLKQRLIDLKMKAVELADFTLIPKYLRAREEFFAKEFGEEAPLTPILEGLIAESEKEVVSSEDIPNDPHAMALDALHQTLSTVVWVKRVADPFNSTEYLVTSMAVKREEDGTNQFVVVLQDRFTNARQSMPLYILLQNFQPTSEPKVVSVH